MVLKNTNTYTAKQRKIALITLAVFIFSLAAPVMAQIGEFVSYSDILRGRGIIDRELSSNQAITYREALHIGIGVGGYPIGCGPSLSPLCDTDAIARTRGLYTSASENSLTSGVIRANAIRLVMRARGIAPSSLPSGYSDVDGKLAPGYVGYIAKAREMQCIQATDRFRPFDYTSEGEYAKMIVCVLGALSGDATFSSAPSSMPIGNTAPTSPVNPSTQIVQVTPQYT
jgi:hypothetical protein